MKVLHLITGLELGGAERSLTELVCFDELNSHRVISLQGKGYFGSQLEGAGIQTDALGMRGMFSTPSAIRRVAMTIDEYKPDVLQCWMYHANLIGGFAARKSKLRPRVIWGIRGPYAREHTPLGTKLAVRIGAMMSSRIPAVIVSNSDYAAATHVSAGYYAKSMKTIANGYRLNDAEKERAGFKLDKRLNSSLVFGTLARFDPHKDHQNLLKAFSKVKAAGINFTVLLVGTDINQSNRKLVKEVARYRLDEEVRLVGPSNDVSAVFNALDFHVLSSNAESFPNVVAEAMLHGVPCISTEVGDVGKIMGDLGWRVASNDSDALAAAVLSACEMVKDPAAYSHLADACRKRIEKEFSLASMRDRFFELWAGASND